MGDFQKLIVWQRAKELAVTIYSLTRNSAFPRDFGFIDQIQRSAVSIAVNVAEGEELGSDKQSIRHFYISRGSSAELLTLLIIGCDIGYFNSEQKEKLVSECRIISVMLTKLIKARLKPRRPDAPTP